MDNNDIFKGKTLLITGGTGSFGKTVCKKFLNTDLKEIRIFSRDEKKQDDLRKHYKNKKLKFYIGDVREKESLVAAIKGVDYVFHAAALKQVPSCEFFPTQAVLTNVIGTENVLNSAIEFSVKKVIVLSTDKAVYPVNAMGMTKGIMEKVMIAKSRDLPLNRTILCGTRYGNVMASRGSVIPLFIKQIKKGEPLTITDPEMTRFLMSLEKAVELVLYAFHNGRQGDLFVQKAPSTTIANIAQALLEIYNADIKIEIIGTRHGEKKYESLMTSEEISRAESINDYYRIPADGRNLNYDKYFTEGALSDAKPYCSSSNDELLLTVKETKQLLLSLDIIKYDTKAI